MIEGGGLGTFAPGRSGPAAQSRIIDSGEGQRTPSPPPNSFFQGPTRTAPTSVLCAMQCREPAGLRAAMLGVVDTGSMLELRAGFGAGIDRRWRAWASLSAWSRTTRTTSAVRSTWRPPTTARFMQLCNAHGCRWCAVRRRASWSAPRSAGAHVCRMFMASHLRVPFFAVVPRRPRPARRQ